MSTFAFVLLCIQACLLQNVFGQCFGPGPYGAYDGFGYGYDAYGPFGEPFAGPLATGPAGAYGGAGIGEVAVAGELPVAGTTLVAGQVPILGAVEFGGPVCAAGSVSIAGSCACGCAGPYGAGAGACAVPYGIGPADLAASKGPGLSISSSSPLIPAGISVISENAYEGTLAAGGAVPLLGTVALEGALPTIGVGAIAYGCGNGAVAITAEEGAAYGYGLAGPYGYAGIAEPFGYGYGLAGPLGYGPGYTGCGCGAL